jgi:hypothetical protein
LKEGVPVELTHNLFVVMPGLVPGIHAPGLFVAKAVMLMAWAHVFRATSNDVPPGHQPHRPNHIKPRGVDGRDKPGHDG